MTSEQHRETGESSKESYSIKNKKKIRGKVYIHTCSKVVPVSSTVVSHRDYIMAKDLGTFLDKF